ncbi:Type IV secretory pathway, VirB4 components [Olavius algarvensis associated proteobacterium Delta 3]|nr:Type IV secretory pathway, VirB4 components [Olavius algarvensis associated proteobacterium Delta 3]
MLTWSAVIAVVLAGLAAGNWVGGELAQRCLTLRGCAVAVGLCLVSAAVSSIVVLATVRFGNHADGSAILPLLLFFIPSFYAGTAPPMLTKIAVDESNGNAGRVLGGMYAMGSLGAIAGALLTGFVAVQWIGSTGTILVIAATYLSLGMMFLVEHKYFRLIAPALVFVMVVVGVVLPAKGISASPAVAAAWRALKGPCETESAYGCIQVRPYETGAGKGRKARVLIIDKLWHSMSDRDPLYLHYSYAHFVDEYARQRHGKTTPVAVFFIGGGGYSLPRAWAVSRPGSQLIVAEIDDAVTAAAASGMWVKDLIGNGTIYNADDDARLVLQRQPKLPLYDIVFGDAFRGGTIPPHLVSREFHREIAARLKNGGVYMVNAIDGSKDPRFVRALCRTLRLEFNTVQVWADPEQMLGRSNFIVLATDAAAAMHSAAEDETLDNTTRRRLREMSHATGLFCEGFTGEVFNRAGQSWPEADVTVIDLATFAREGYEAHLAISVVSCLNMINNIAERDQFEWREIVVTIDEAHIITTNPLLAPFLVKIVKMWRKLGACQWLCIGGIPPWPTLKVTLKVKHRLPELVVGAWHANGEADWSFLYRVPSRGLVLGRRCDQPGRPGCRQSPLVFEV